MNIGVAFNADIRNNGTATFARVALKEIAKENGWTVQHWRPGGEPPKKDWWIYIDDGRDEITWTPPRPWAYWAVDTHLGYAYRLWKARQADRVFVAQKPAVEDFKRDGVKHVEWLPLACQPDAHPTYSELLAKGFAAADLTLMWDWAFVGFFGGAPDGCNDRVAYLDRLQREIPNGWITPGVFFEDMAIRYVKARLGFNISIKNDLNMRCFEVMGMGVPLLTNRDVVGIDELFEEGKHFIGYQGPDEMVAVAREALRHPEETARIGVAGLEEARGRHTYKHRMKVVAEEMKGV